MENLNFDIAAKKCQERYYEKPIHFNGVALAQPVFDFVNSQKLRSEFEQISSLAKNFKSHFIAELDCNDDFIYYRIKSFDGKILAEAKKMRGLSCLAAFEFYVFTISVNLSVNSTLSEQQILYFTEPKKSIFWEAV